MENKFLALDFAYLNRLKYNYIKKSKTFQKKMINKEYFKSGTWKMLNTYN